MSTQKKQAVERSGTKKPSKREHLGCHRVLDKHFLKRVGRRYLVANCCSRILGWIWCATKRDNNGSRLPCVCALGSRLAVNLRFCVGWRRPLGFRGRLCFVKIGCGVAANYVFLLERNFSNQRKINSNIQNQFDFRTYHYRVMNTYNR